MNTVYFPPIADASVALRPSVATVGFFDGVHRGHCHLIRLLRQKAAEQGLATTVITFERHPRQVLCPDWQPQLLTTLSEKAELLEAAGAEQLVVLRFDRDMAALSAREFMQQVLYRQLGVRTLITGYDNRFGHNRAEGFSDYFRYGQEMGMEVLAGTPLVLPGEQVVSSSEVRRLLQQGDVGTAATCLGHPYFVCGTVVGGHHIGTALGFPTANIQPTEPLKLIPRPGVYAVSAVVAESSYPAMMNIGTRPTFAGQEQTLEVHLLHYEGDLYGQQLTVSFRQWLRVEQRFDSQEALVAQLRRDAARTCELFSE